MLKRFSLEAKIIDWTIFIFVAGFVLAIGVFLEEYIFRKNFQSLLTKRSVPYATLLVSQLFALYHFKHEMTGFLVVFLMSLFLNFIYVKTGTIVFSFLFHFSYDVFIVYFEWNRVALPVFLLSPGLIICSGVLVLSVFVVLRFNRAYVSYYRPIKFSPEFSQWAWGGLGLFLLLKVLLYWVLIQG